MRKPSSLVASAIPSSKPASTPASTLPTASILLLFLALVLPAQSFAEDSTALNAQTQAYITLVYADEARDLENWNEAGIHYRKAVNEYKQIQSAHPDFNDKIMSYRIAYCQNQLSAIEKKLSPVRQTEPGADLFESKYNATKQENAYLRNRLEELEEEVDQAGESTDLKKEITRLQLEVAHLKSGAAHPDADLLKDVQRAKDEANHFRAEVDRQKTLLAELKVIAAEHEQGADRMREQDSEVENLKAANREVTERLKKSEQAATDKNQSRGSTSAKREAAFKEIKSQVKNEQNINRQLIAQVASADQRVRELNESNEKQTKELTQFGQQIATLLTREREAAIALAAHKKELEALHKERDEAKPATPQGPSLAMEADMIALTRKWENSTKMLETLEEESNALTKRNATLQKLLQEEEAQVKELQDGVMGAKKFRNLEKENKDLLAEIKQLKDTRNTELAEARTVATADEKEIRKLSEELNVLRNAKTSDQAETATLEKEYAAALSKSKTLENENARLKKNLKISLNALDDLEVAMDKSIANFTHPVQEEADRLMEEVAELTSYQESVGGITSKELARLREDLTRLKAPPPPKEPEETDETEEKPPLEIMLREGEAREREGLLEEASALYARILEVAPGDTGAAKGLSRIYLQTGQPEKVEPLLEAIFKNNRHDAEGLYLLGLAQYSLNDFREAVSTLKKLVKKHTEDSRGWNALGASFMAQEKFQDARESFARAIALDSELGESHYNLAQVLRIYSPKEKELIREHYQAAIALGNNADAEMDEFLKAE